MLRQPAQGSGGEVIAGGWSLRWSVGVGPGGWGAEACYPGCSCGDGVGEWIAVEDGWIVVGSLDQGWGSVDLQGDKTNAQISLADPFLRESERRPD
jgi:hypothetical protein